MLFSLPKIQFEIPNMNFNGNKFIECHGYFFVFLNCMSSFKKILVGFIFFQLCFVRMATAQTDTTFDDAVQEVVVRGYSIQKSPASVDSIQPTLHQPSFTLVSGLNTLPGVRMEERSPGSYRLSIRGSLLRSPFSVRNIKMYLDDFPLTDAGGNTYLNALDPSSISSMEGMI